MATLISRITLDPGVMVGKPCIRGMRVTVSTVLGLLGAGKSHPEVLEAYPYLEEADILAALQYAAWIASQSGSPISAPNPFRS